MEQLIDPNKLYSLNEAVRFTTIKSFSTFRRYVDAGHIKAERNSHGYLIKGSDLIEFIAKLEAGDFKK